MVQKDRVFDNTVPSDSSSDSSSDDSIESGDEVPSGTKLAIFELQNRFSNISEAVNNLIKLAEIIRSTGSRSRTSRATQYEHIEDGVNHTLAFENDFLPLVLKHKFKLDGPLLERFRKAIGSRRRRFLYQAKHQKRLAYGHDIQLEDPVAPKARQEFRTTPTRTPNAPVIRHTVPEKRAVDNGTEAPTQATTFRLVNQPKAPSAIVSTSSKFDASGIDLPLPPPIPTAKATHFECPYCCVLVPIAKREKRRWRQHVIEDLQPFICIEPHCPTPDIVLESRSDWVEHQRWEHAIQWWCEGGEADHPAVQFSTEDAFLAHLSESHPSHTSSGTIKRRAQMASHPSLMPFSCCPFCDFLPADFATLSIERPDTVLRAAVSQKTLQEHLTHELLNIFLIALPERVDLEDDVSGTDAERSPGNRSTVLGELEVDDDFTYTWDGLRSPSWLVAEGAGYEDIIDPEVSNSIWATVWASPQLRKSVRESYEGPALDAHIKHIALRQDQHDSLEKAQLEYGIWIPGISINNEKLSSPRLVPSLYDRAISDPTRNILGDRIPRPPYYKGNTLYTIADIFDTAEQDDKKLNFGCFCCAPEQDAVHTTRCPKCLTWHNEQCSYHWDFYTLLRVSGCCPKCVPEEDAELAVR